MTTKRRGYGEGSIFQRADGRWAATIVVGRNSAGKRIRRTVYGKAKQDVQRQLSDLVTRKAIGTLTAASRETVAAYLKWWLETIAQPKVRATTYASYQGTIEKHINPRIGGDALQKLTAMRVQSLDTEMIRDGCSPRMRQLTHAILRAALNRAVKLGRLARNVCDAVDVPTVPKVEIKPLDEIQAAALLKAAEGGRFEALFMLAVTSGLRQGELFGLKWEDVDFEQNALSVRNTLIEVKGKLSIGPPKSRAGTRTVRIPQIAVNALLDHRRRMLAEGHAGSGFVFVDSCGHWLRKSNFTRNVFKPLLAAAGLPDIRFHDLRHTHASLLLLAGESAKVMQERLGHSQISLTMNTYAHVLPAAHQATADRLDRMFPTAGAG